MEAFSSSEMPVLTRATRRNILEDRVLLYPFAYCPSIFLSLGDNAPGEVSTNWRSRVGQCQELRIVIEYPRKQSEREGHFRLGNATVST
jgi:hypothetical protein